MQPPCVLCESRSTSRPAHHRISRLELRILSWNGAYSGIRRKFSPLSACTDSDVHALARRPCTSGDGSDWPGLGSCQPRPLPEPIPSKLAWTAHGRGKAPAPASVSPRARFPSRVANPFCQRHVSRDVRKVFAPMDVWWSPSRSDPWPRRSRRLITTADSDVSSLNRIVRSTSWAAKQHRSGGITSRDAKPFVGWAILRDLAKAFAPLGAIAARGKRAIRAIGRLGADDTCGDIGACVPWGMRALGHARFGACLFWAGGLCAQMVIRLRPA